MHKFSRVLFQFFLCAVIVFVLVFIFLNYGVSSKIKNLKHQGTNILVMGDSHIKLGINDELIPNAVNLSNNNEPLFFSYYKLKTIFENDPSIESVYLGMAYHSISSGYDPSIYGNGKQSVASKYFFILPYNQQLEIIESNYLNLAGLGRQTILNGFRTIFYDSNKNPLLGGFQNEFTDVRGDSLLINERINYHFFDNGSLNNFSEVNIAYLEKIKDLCQENQTELILINTPLHPYYKEKVPVAFKEKYFTLINSLDLKLINLEDLPLKNNNYTPDGDHVSREGADITTMELLNN